MQSSQEKDFFTKEIDAWKIIGLIILAIRFVQGFIFWGGGSRRFIYAPQKLDPDSSMWLANKLQSAMPGALLGLSHAISFLLHHFVLLYIAIILFSLAELLSGLALIIGFFTRTAGLITALISFFLMLLFGWEGSTCLDEWTMAISNFAMGLTLALSGSSIYSVDAWLLRRHPRLATDWWFTETASGYWPFTKVRRLSLFCFVTVVFFALVTYNYYRGSIYSPYHSGPVSPIIHNIALQNGVVKSDGSITFHAYVNEGNTSIPSHIMRIELRNANKDEVEVWDGIQLGGLTTKAIDNDYIYNRFTTDQYGLVAPVSASATISLPAINNNIMLSPGHYQLVIYTISGRRFELTLAFKPQQ